MASKRKAKGNAQYIKGVVLEREIVNTFKEAGCQAWRSAGSHGPYDVQAVGPTDIVRKGWAGLDAKGFLWTGTEAVRVGTAYVDILYVEWFETDDRAAYFIQCKRKRKDKAYGQNKRTS